VTDTQTDGRTELRWLKRATAVAAVARKMVSIQIDNMSDSIRGRFGVKADSW